MKKLVAVAVLAASVACGDDSPVVTVTGAWTASITLNGTGLTCSLLVPMDLTQSGATFSGTYTDASVTCNGQTSTGIGGTVINGHIVSRDVSFDLDDPSAHQEGTIDGNTMTGTANWVINTSGGAVGLSGTWSATR